MFALSKGIISIERFVLFIDFSWTTLSIQRKLIMSFFALGEAVAVSAKTGIFLLISLKLSTKNPKFRYENLKSCHHSLKQWASSTAKMEM
ncbi:hypothetical protein IKI14_03115 [bacterium]|nr:hypothetical protein [bacterium]